MSIDVNLEKVFSLENTGFVESSSDLFGPGTVVLLLIIIGCCASAIAIGEDNEAFSA